MNQLPPSFPPKEESHTQSLQILNFLPFSSKFPIRNPNYFLSAFTASAALTNQTPFLIDQAIRVTAFGAFAVDGCGAVFNVFLEGTLYACFPGVEGIDRYCHFFSFFVYFASRLFSPFTFFQSS
ncbi:MAG: hypothetical protein H0W62_13570 [Chitinophagales bacterium]|nr:hypothetical protein [Chitinophagales bacterium]